MGLDVSQERRIDAPPERVAAFAFDPANDTAWIGGIKRVRVLTDGPLGIGTRVERTASAFFPMTVRYEIAGGGGARWRGWRSRAIPVPPTGSEGG